MSVEVERYHRVVVDDVLHGEFEQSGVLQPEEECQGASRADIERQRIIDEAPVQVFGLVLVRAEDAGRGDGDPWDYELAGQAPASRPGDEGTHLTTFLKERFVPARLFDISGGRATSGGRACVTIGSCGPVLCSCVRDRP
ncbi:hypothetical protein PUR49_01105 [Streptomyces sp. BE147]|uniref:hypothetical protein n=1 Tax=Streptomyces sp. BE147 TaxID=3002524 RepID=UPI002E79B1F6|nr:hypothetical protein [Streptomyces sp. BE147]MEE1735150.1 hypothetical protein [Streptomyces sp. BE147]